MKGLKEGGGFELGFEIRFEGGGGAGKGDYFQGGV